MQRYRWQRTRAAACGEESRAEAASNPRGGPDERGGAAREKLARKTQEPDEKFKEGVSWW